MDIETNDNDQFLIKKLKKGSKRFVDKYILPIILSMIATLIYNTITLHQINDRLIAIENSNNNINNNNFNFNFQGLQTTDAGKIDINYDEQYLIASNDTNKLYLPENNDSENYNQENNNDVISLSAIQDVAIYSIDEPSWSSNDIIAVNTESGEKYTAKELADKKILLPYKSGNQEYYFYGQFNENNQWDGDCIINVYENNNLMSIMESKYENGTLLAYKQVFQSSKTNYDVWNFSDRINNSDYTTGKTWCYFKYAEYTKDFIYEDVTIDNILDINSFESIIKENGVEEYYYGRTSNGFFNDTTGDACLVKFFQNGTTRLVYCGNFKDGFPDDQTGKAWYIVRGENTTYMYYMGNFEDNRTQNNIGYIFENYLTKERIEELLKENHWENKNYEYELKFDCSYNEEQE